MAHLGDYWIMACEVNDIYPQFTEIYMYTTITKHLQTSLKKTARACQCERKKTCPEKPDNRRRNA